MIDQIPDPFEVDLDDPNAVRRVAGLNPHHGPTEDANNEVPDDGGEGVRLQILLF